MHLCEHQHLVAALDPLASSPSGRKGVVELPLHVVEAITEVCFDDDDGELHELKITDEKGKVVTQATAGDPCLKQPLVPGDYSVTLTHETPEGHDGDPDVVHTRLVRAAASPGNPATLRLQVQSNGCPGCNLDGQELPELRVDFASDDDYAPDHATRIAGLSGDYRGASLRNMRLPSGFTGNDTFVIFAAFSQLSNFDGADFSGTDTRYYNGGRCRDTYFAKDRRQPGIYGWAVSMRGAKLGMKTCGLTLLNADLVGAELKFPSTSERGALILRDGVGAHLDPSVFEQFRSASFVGSNSIGVREFEALQDAVDQGRSVRFDEATMYLRFNETYRHLPRASTFPMSHFSIQTSEVGDLLMGSSFIGARYTDLDMRWQPLTTTRFDGASLTGGRFDDAQANATRFDNSVLSGVSFARADLRGSSFVNVGLQNTNFSGADLSGSTLSVAAPPPGIDLVARIENAIFRAGRIQQSARTKVSFAGTDLSGTDLGESDFTDGNFTYANLTGATFGDRGFGKLTRATLTGTRLHALSAPGWSFAEASAALLDVRDANLRGAKFTKATLTGSTFCGTDLTQVDFAGANMSNALVGASTTSDIYRVGGRTIVCPANTGRAQAITSAATLCPNGSPGPCVSDAQWVPVGTVNTCVPSVPPQPQKKSGASCASDCDCVSVACLSTMKCK